MIPLCVVSARALKPLLTHFKRELEAIKEDPPNLSRRGGRPADGGLCLYSIQEAGNNAASPGACGADVTV
jgi:hypothetical protein